MSIVRVRPHWTRAKRDGVPEKGSREGCGAANEALSLVRLISRAARRYSRAIFSNLLRLSGVAASSASSEQRRAYSSKSFPICDGISVTSILTNAAIIFPTQHCSSGPAGVSWEFHFPATTDLEGTSGGVIVRSQGPCSSGK